MTLEISDLSSSVALGYGTQNIMNQIYNFLFANGNYPFSNDRSGNYVRAEEYKELVKDAQYRTSGKFGDSSLHINNDYILYISRNTANDSITISCCSKKDGVSIQVVDDIIKKTIDTSVVNDNVVMGFWRDTGNGFARSPQKIEAPTWQEVNLNYSAKPRATIEKLMNIKLRGDGFGKLLLLHGPPGTGKTTLIRALAKEWRNWCDTEFILDPDRFFQDPNYILEVALGDDDDCYEEDAKKKDKWKLLILEDCDEIISGEAKQRTGQALARLLNLTDGILGQGKKVLVAITTNEDIKELHKAVTRPGRCLAQIAVGRLTRTECVDWLENDEELVKKVPDEGMTLAELFALKFNSGPEEALDDFITESTGMYL